MMYSMNRRCWMMGLGALAALPACQSLPSDLELRQARAEVALLRGMGGLAKAGAVHITLYRNVDYHGWLDSLESWAATQDIIAGLAVAGLKVPAANIRCVSGDPARLGQALRQVQEAGAQLSLVLFSSHMTEEGLIHLPGASGAFSAAGLGGLLQGHAVPTLLVMDTCYARLMERHMPAAPPQRWCLSTAAGTAVLAEIDTRRRWSEIVAYCRPNRLFLQEALGQAPDRCSALAMSFTQALRLMAGATQPLSLGTLVEETLAQSISLSSCRGMARHSAARIDGDLSFLRAWPLTAQPKTVEST